MTRHEASEAVRAAIRLAVRAEYMMDRRPGIERDRMDAIKRERDEAIERIVSALIYSGRDARLTLYP